MAGLEMPSLPPAWVGPPLVKLVLLANMDAIGAARPRHATLRSSTRRANPGRRGGALVGPAARPPRRDGARRPRRRERVLSARLRLAAGGRFRPCDRRLHPRDRARAGARRVVPGPWLLPTTQGRARPRPGRLRRGDPARPDRSVALLSSRICSGVEERDGRSGGEAGGLRPGGRRLHRGDPPRPREGGNATVGGASRGG